jgi:hypothetical protein
MSFLRRLQAIEAEVERLSAGADRAARLLATPAEPLTAAEAVELWRLLCEAPPGGQDRRVDLDDLDEAAALAEWERLTRR